MVRLIERFRRAGARSFPGLAVCALLAGLLAGCADDKNAIAPDEPADKLYNEGLTLLNKKEFVDSAKKFEEVDRQHPYSDWGRKSLLMAAFAYYEGGKYDDTIMAAKRYVTLHPGSSDAAYAQYLMASAYFDQIPDVSRDQGTTEKAIAALDEVNRGSTVTAASRVLLLVRRFDEVHMDGNAMLLGAVGQHGKPLVGAPLLVRRR